jgi:valyl-tRNA synthetase
LNFSRRSPSRACRTAPADVVEQEKQRLQEFQAMLKALNEQSARLSQL